MGYYEDAKQELGNLISQIEQRKRDLKELGEQTEKHINEIAAYAQEQIAYGNFLKTGAKKIAHERQMGYPWLANAYKELFSTNDKLIEHNLLIKKRPAKVASETVKEQTKLRREAERKLKIAEGLIGYYEEIAPFLIDFKEELFDDESTDDNTCYQEYTDDERNDETTNYLTKDEYRSLPTVKKNQLALNRYWQRKKSKAQIGRMYERYIGYLFEIRGYSVSYEGIIRGFEDLGRDLICKKDNEIIVIQCKYWSKFKTIYEKHIFQFFGTVFQLQKENPNKKVSGAFYTSTKLSDLARHFSNELKIDLQEEKTIDKSYPIIKCHYNKLNKTKIYHLPFDQQYDNIIMPKHSDSFYCKSVQEAESAGFRRAFKYKGYKNN